MADPSKQPDISKASETTKVPAAEHEDDGISPEVNLKTIHRHEDGDIALDFAAQLDAGYEVLPEVERRVRHKIDFILLPLISCTATLSFLDKVSNNYANNVSMGFQRRDTFGETQKVADHFSMDCPKPFIWRATSSRGVPRSFTLPFLYGSLRFHI